MPDVPPIPLVTVHLQLLRAGRRIDLTRRTHQQPKPRLRH